MLLLTILLFLTAVPDQSLEQEEDEEDEVEEDLPEGSGVSLEDQQLIVDKYNELRRNVAPPATNMLKMIWNETVGENAKRWTEKCKPENSPVKERMFDVGVACGQSIFLTNFPFSWSYIVDYWHNSSRYFEYGVGPLEPYENVYGYIQAIWYQSYQIGCAVSHCPQNIESFIYVCEFCPGGNAASNIATPYKAGPPCGHCPNHCEDGLCTNPCRYVDLYAHCAELKRHVRCKNANKDGLCNATCKCRNKIK